MFRSWTSSFAKTPAICTEHGLLSYSDLSSQIEAAAQALAKQGLGPGKRAAFLAKTDMQTLVAFFALLEIGASPCLLSTRLPKEAISSHLAQARASFFLDSLDAIAQTACESPSTQTQTISLFTSGSSGTPKLACLKVDHFLANAKSSIAALGLQGEGHRWLLSVPLFHVSGLSLLFRCFLSGSCVLFPSSNSFFDLVQATHVSWVPTQLLRILENSVPLPLLQTALIGGAPIPQNLIEKALEKKIPLALTYGMTECASQITMTLFEDPLLPVHVGKPLAGKEIRLSPSGEILLRADSLFIGYETNGEVQLDLSEEGWFPTGDLGKWTLDGNLTLQGRKDRMFISGGENISPERIESALGSIPGLLESAVLPLEDPIYGQRPVAFVRFEKGASMEKEAIYERLSHLLPKFYFPMEFFPFPAEEERAGLKINSSQLKGWLQKLLLEKR